MFSLRIVTTDYRMEAPLPGFDSTISEFRKTPIYRVPVIRIFGSTPLGQKACLNLHGIFPYLYVSLDGNVSPSDFQLQQFASSLDKALNIALGRSSSTSQHVYKVIVVSGIPYYGYHAKECLFMKIFLYSPFMIKKAADLLLAGAIMNRAFQPHESHIPYVLQMFMDYNLFGMNFVRLSSIKFRLPVPPYDSEASQWNSASVIGDLVCHEKKLTRCELEVDGLACNILNKEELSTGMTGNPGLLALWEEEKMRCKNIGLNSQMTPSSSPERSPLTIASEEKLKVEFHEILKSFKLESQFSDEVANSKEAFNETDSETIVCERTILDVVNHSRNFMEESFRKDKSQSLDSSFANMLASLVHDGRSSIRQKYQTEIEDFDSILSQSSTPRKTNIMTGREDLENNDEEENDDAVHLEMSQCLDPKEQEPVIIENHISKKHGFSPDDQTMDEKSKRIKITLSPIRTRQLMEMKSLLLRRHNLKQQNVLDEQNYLKEKAVKFTPIKVDLQKRRLASSKVLVVDKISLDAIRISKDSDENVLKHTHSSKLLSELMRKVKGKELSFCDASQQEALESLALLSSPDSSGSHFGTPPNPDLTAGDNPISPSKDETSEEETTLIEHEKQIDNLENCSNDAFETVVHQVFESRIKGRDILRAINPTEPPLSYTDVERDVVSGRFSSANTNATRNAVKLFQKKMILSQKNEELRLQPGLVEDLVEHNSCEFSYGLNDLKHMLKSREEDSLSTFLTKTNKDKAKHVCAPFLNDECSMYIVPVISPPLYNFVKRSLKCNKGKSPTCSKKEATVPANFDNEFNFCSDFGNKITTERKEKVLTVSFNTQKKVLSDICSTQINVNKSQEGRIHSSTPISRISNGNLLEAKHSECIIGSIEESNSALSEDVRLNQKAHKVSTNNAKKLRGIESQIEAATPANMFNFKVDSQNLQDMKNLSQSQFLCIISLELHISTRGQLDPDPEYDSIEAAFYHVSDERPNPRLRSKSDEITKPPVGQIKSGNFQELGKDKNSMSGIFLVLDKDQRSSVFLQEDVQLNFCNNELELMTKVIELVIRHDADVLVGYEIQKLSWGYLIQRAATLNIFLPVKLSRYEEYEESQKKKIPREFSNHRKEDLLLSSDVFIPGRIVLDLWRILRHEVSLNIYTFENVSFHVLHERIPHFSFRALTSWFNHKNSLHRWKTLEYYIIRCRGNLRIMEQLDVIGQTSEFARIYGIEFYDVLSRGSQYRVESMMLRLAKPQNFIAVSPSIQQRAAMRSPECIPLNLEPRSDFYTDPIVVLDFQSLYPSIMIAYNYCFSTCLGRMQHFSRAKDGPFEFGCTSLYVPEDLLDTLKEDINICSNGVVFVKSNIRKGIIPSMVEEILNTRLMIKKAMKIHKENKGLQRILHARQLGLKLIANVTFGYTAANFSGRMACVEIGDSIMRKARDTLEAAISLVEKNIGWGAEVVYGDTDSMFVLLRGRSKLQAFTIGQEISEAVTRSNPKPVKLKLEKIYMPCILQTKKRYVGFMYESVDQKEPVFDAKGIETVRRDNCPAVSKILERSLKILFATCDLSLVRDYVQKQCIKILDGRTVLQDFIFAKEYRGMGSYRPNACIPALEIARQRVSRDRRAEPLIGERVPYVIIRGTSCQPLIKLVKQPLEIMEDCSLKINSTYYLLKQILPTINRFTMLFGVEALQWFNDLPRTLKVDQNLFDQCITEKNKHIRNNMNQYISHVDCCICGELCDSEICDGCRGDKQKRLFFIYSKIRKNQVQFYEAQQVCSICKGWQEPDDSSCISLECPIFFQCIRSRTSLIRAQSLLKFQDF